MKCTKTLSAMSFAAYDVERRTRKGSFYSQVDTIIDWKPISAIIDEHYQKGLSVSGESFAAYDVERRTRKGSFYSQVDTIIDWKPISAIIDEHYQKGLSVSGEKPYDGLLLFKMLLIGMWNNLSDVKVEEHVNDSLSAIKQERFFNEVAEDGVDKEARWLKKGTKTYFGYKKQIAVDSKTVWCGVDTFKRLGQGTHATYFGSHCLQSEAKS